MAPYTADIARIFVFSWIGCLATLSAKMLGLGSVLASAMVCVGGAFFILGMLRAAPLPFAATSLMGGSFAGMTDLNRWLGSLGFTPTPDFMIAAFVLAGVSAAVAVFVHWATLRWPITLLDGFGGKLGASAMIGVILADLMITGSITVHSLTIDRVDGQTMFFYLLAVGMAAGGAVLPRLIWGQGWAKACPEERVFWVAWFALIVTIVLSPIPWAQIHLGLPAFFYAGLFVAMTRATLLPTATSLVIAGTIAGVGVMGLGLILAGAGGLLGTAAMLGVVAVVFGAGGKKPSRDPL